MRRTSRSPSYLVRTPYSYCFRINVPVDIQMFVDRKELRYSLRTGYISVAKLKARIIAGQVQLLFKFLKNGNTTLMNLSTNQIKELVQKYLRQLIDSYVTPAPPDESLLPFHDQPTFNSYVNILDSTKEEFILSRAMGKFDYVDEKAKQLLKENGVADIDKDSPAYRRLCEELMVAEIKGIEFHKKHLLGEHSGATGSVFPTASESPEEEPAMLLEDVIEDYKKKRIKSKLWRPNTVRNHQPKINTLLQVLGNRPVNRISTPDIEKLARLLELLPPGFARLKDYKNISGLEPKDIEGKFNKVLDVSTQRNYLTFAKTIFDHAIARECITRNPVVSGIIPPKKKSTRNLRFPFDEPKDLEKIFNPDTYIKACRGRPSRFWVPILALYTGCRLEEMCQLYIEDVQEIDGVWCLDVKGLTSAASAGEDDDQMLKYISNPRKVPLHPFIVDELKFPTFVKKMRGRRNKRIFSELKKYNHKYGHKVSSWFNYYIRTKKVGITDPKKTFHSFRHNVADHLYKKLVPESLIEELEGRAGKTETRRTYTMGQTVKNLYNECILKLDYNVDLSHLKESKYVPKD